MCTGMTHRRNLGVIERKLGMKIGVLTEKVEIGIELWKRGFQDITCVVNGKKAQAIKDARDIRCFVRDLQHYSVQNLGCSWIIYCLLFL